MNTMKWLKIFYIQRDIKNISKISLARLPCLTCSFNNKLSALF